MRFDEDKEKMRRRNIYATFTSIRDIFMGILFIGASVFFWKPSILSKDFDVHENIALKFLSVITLLYGIFRIYRGIKKDYFYEEEDDDE